MPALHDSKDIATQHEKAVEAREKAVEMREMAVKYREHAVEDREIAVKTSEEKVDAEVERRVRDLRAELTTLIASAEERERVAAEREAAASDKERALVATKDAELSKALVDFILQQKHPHMDALHYGLGLTALVLGGHVAHTSGWSRNKFCIVLLNILKPICNRAAADLQVAVTKGFQQRLMPTTIVPPFPSDLGALPEAVRSHAAAIVGPSVVVPVGKPNTLSNRVMEAASLAGIHPPAWDIVEGQMLAYLNALYRHASAGNLPAGFNTERVMSVWQDKVVGPFGDQWADICDVDL